MSYHPMQKLTGRERRRVRVRKRVFGTAERPRLSVYRSAKHIYAQVINDETGTTLASASSNDKNVRGSAPESDEGGKVRWAKAVGQAVAKACKEKNITSVAFDRNGYKYHGRVKAVAEGAREGGLDF